MAKTELDNEFIFKLESKTPEDLTLTFKGDFDQLSYALYCAAKENPVVLYSLSMALDILKDDELNIENEE